MLPSLRCNFIFSELYLTLSTKLILCGNHPPSNKINCRVHIISDYDALGGGNCERKKYSDFQFQVYIFLHIRKTT